MSKFLCGHLLVLVTFALLGAGCGNGTDCSTTFQCFADNTCPDGYLCGKGCCFCKKPVNPYEGFCPNNFGDDGVGCCVPVISDGGAADGGAEEPLNLAGGTDARFGPTIFAPWRLRVSPK